MGRRAQSNPWPSYESEEQTCPLRTRGAMKGRVKWGADSPEGLDAPGFAQTLLSHCYVFNGGGAWPLSAFFFPDVCSVQKPPLPGVEFL
jgi:hypothetical protein